MRKKVSKQTKKILFLILFQKIGYKCLCKLSFEVCDALLKHLKDSHGFDDEAALNLVKLQQRQALKVGSTAGIVFELLANVFLKPALPEKSIRYPSKLVIKIL